MKKNIMLGIALVALCGCGTAGRLSHSTVNTSAAIGTALVNYTADFLHIVIDKTQVTGTNVASTVENVLMK